MQVYTGAPCPVTDVFLGAPSSMIEEFCMPLLQHDLTGLVRYAIDEFYTRFRTDDLCSFVTHVLNDRLIGRHETAWSAVPSMCAAIGMPLRHIWTDDSEYYDFYNEPYYCVSS